MTVNERGEGQAPPEANATGVTVKSNGLSVNFSGSGASPNFEQPIDSAFFTHGSSGSTSSGFVSVSVLVVVVTELSTFTTEVDEVVTLVTLVV